MKATTIGVLALLGGAVAGWTVATVSHRAALRRADANVHKTEAQLADIRKAMWAAGLTKSAESTEVSTQWWCFSPFCERTEAKCKAKLAEVTNEQGRDPEVKKHFQAESCRPARIAFCVGSHCYQEISACLALQDQTSRFACHGVE